jgi:hypothetical protein
MSLIENDPRKTAYIALLIAITWYEQLTPEAALDLVQGQSRRKPGQKLTIGIFAQMKKVIDSPNFYNVNTLVKKYRVNKYEIFEALTGDKNANEEVIAMVQTEKHLKKLKEFAENCTAVDCEKCPLDKIMVGESTLCEVLEDADINEDGKLEIGLSKATQKNAKKRKVELMTGEMKSQGVNVYIKLWEAIDERVTKLRIKKQDIINIALAEYLERHKSN